MTAPIRNLDRVYRKTSPPRHQGSLERYAEVIALTVIILLLLYAGWMLLRRDFITPSPVREITPAEFHRVKLLEKEFKLRGHLWVYDQANRKIDYWRNGEWREISLVGVNHGLFIRH